MANTKIKSKIKSKISSKIDEAADLKSKKKHEMKNPKRIAVYPGSFDPIHNGHVDVIYRISKIFDQVVVLVAKNTEKKGLFSASERIKLIQSSLMGLKNVEVKLHDGLTVDFLKSIGANVIVRGLRATVDFESELAMANMNRHLAPEIETLLIFSNPDHYYISSKSVREVASFKGSLTGLVPTTVEEEIEKKGSL